MNISPLVRNIGIGVGVAAGIAFLASCASETEPQKKVLDEFSGFDRKPEDNKFTKDEAVRVRESGAYTVNRVLTYRRGDRQYFREQVVHDRTTHSMLKAYEAAKGNDAIASVAELTALATTFDKDGNGTLNRKEKNAFLDMYRPTTRTVTLHDGYQESWYRVDDYPDTYPGIPGGGTGTGDTSGHGGSTGTGDTGGSYTPPNGGSGNTGGGDSPTPTRPPSGDTPSRPPSGDTPAPTRPPSTNGDSSSNGNPNDDDF